MSETLPDLIEEVISHSDLSESGVGIAAIIAQADEDEMASLLESLPIEQRLSLWQTLPDHKKLDILIAMRGDPREVLVRATEPENGISCLLVLKRKTCLNWPTHCLKS